MPVMTGCWVFTRKNRCILSDSHWLIHQKRATVPPAQEARAEMSEKEHWRAPREVYRSICYVDVQAHSEQEQLVDSGQQTEFHPEIFKTPQISCFPLLWIHTKARSDCLNFSRIFDRNRALCIRPSCGWFLLTVGNFFVRDSADFLGWWTWYCSDQPNKQNNHVNAGITSLSSTIYTARRIKGEQQQWKPQKKIDLLFLCR